MRANLIREWFSNSLSDAIDAGEQPEEQAADVISNEVEEAATGGKEQFLLAPWTDAKPTWLENDHDDVDTNVTTTEVDVAASEGMYTFNYMRIPSHQNLFIQNIPSTPITLWMEPTNTRMRALLPLMELNTSTMKTNGTT